MRRYLAAGAALIFIAGCQSGEQAFQGPSGQMIHETKCNGSPSACYKQATNACGGSYQVLDSSSNAGGLVADIIPGPVTWYRMSFQCGKSDGRLPSFPFRGQQYRAPSTTNCSAFGNTVNCTTY